MRNLAFINEMQWSNGTRGGLIDAKEIPREKTDFAEVTESLDADLKIIMSSHQNNYVERSSVSRWNIDTLRVIIIRQL